MLNRTNFYASVIVIVIFLLPHVVLALLSPQTQWQLQELTDWYAANPKLFEGSSSRSRKILQRRHAAQYFAGDTLFHSFARTVCCANAVPRKELLETWATALHIHDRFSSARRIADVACGHGLLSWALLVMDDHDRDNFQNYDGGDHQKQEQQQVRTAVCIDKRMPPSAEKIAAVMMDEYPHLESRWDFVEGTLRDITLAPSSPGPSPSTKGTTLLCGVHACGVLTDQIMALGMAGNAPMALVPCCHSQKSLDDLERQEYDAMARPTSSSSGGHSNSDSSTTLARFVDTKRIQRLAGKAGFQVERRQIPNEFTPQNTVLLASPSTNNKRVVADTDQQPSMRSRISSKSRRFPSLFTIPINDNEQSRRVVRSMAGRKEAIQRKRPPPPRLCVSLSMPPDKAQHVSPPQLSNLITQLLLLLMPSTTTTTTTTTMEQDAGNAPTEISTHTTMSATVEYADTEAYWHPQSGRYFRTFQIEYHDDNSSLEGASSRKTTVKEIHTRVCDEIPVASPGCFVRS